MIFECLLELLVPMESNIWVRAAPVQCEYGTRTRTVRVFGNTNKYILLKYNFFSQNNRGILNSNSDIAWEVYFFISAF